MLISSEAYLLLAVYSEMSARTCILTGDFSFSWGFFDIGMSLFHRACLHGMELMSFIIGYELQTPKDSYL